MENKTSLTLNFVNKLTLALSEYCEEMSLAYENMLLGVMPSFISIGDHGILF